MKKVFIEAHKMTKKMVEEYGVDYQTQFGLNLSYLLEKEEEKEMLVELKGSEKQVKWAEDLREKMIVCLENRISATEEKFGNMEMSDIEKANLNAGQNFLKEKLEEMKKQDESTWFIDKRNYLIESRINPDRYTSIKYNELKVIEMYNLNLNDLVTKSLKVAYTNTQKEYIALF